jgi:DNA polymerase III gamma/tau subunit
LVVAALARRVRAGDVCHHIALEGPSGVGKRTLARLYAQALMCEAPLASGSPCLTCWSCESILADNALNFRPVDAREHGSEKVARQLVNITRYAPLGVERRSILIWNAEACKDAALDMLLNTLEERISTVFIFTTTNWSKLRPAIRSRCQVYPLRPLTAAAAIERLVRLCDREGVSYEAEALDVVAAQAHARAGTLLRRLCEVAAGGAVTLARVRETFGLTWTEPMSACWSALLAGDEDDAFGSLTAVSTQARESLRRMRAFVQMLDLRWALGPAVALSLDPACIHLPQHVGETIRKELEMRASSQAYSFDKLWGIILRFWCDCDAREWIGVRQELLAFQRLIALKCQAEPAP